MEVKLAKSAGFCFGVNKAMEKVYEQIEHFQGEKIYTYGPIIHNEEVVKELASKGVEVIEALEDLDRKEKGVLIIRSHGVAKDVQARLKMHRTGKGAKYTRGRSPLELLYTEVCENKSIALKRELSIKALPREEKMKLIEQSAVR